ncbi:MAG: proteinral secretion pathway protein I [Comamonadaceae bacterium]|nr:MAG: proteinral secretion pathway protein I [Comamonadaceae bacterium]
MKAACRKAEQGFSLLELLVAFAIMAISLGFIYKAMGTSTRQVADATDMQRATMIIDGLAKSRDSVDSQGWQETGEQDGFAWQVDSEPYGTGNAATGAVRLFKVVLRVRWSEGERPKVLTVETLLPQRQPIPGERIR